MIFEIAQLWSIAAQIWIGIVLLYWTVQALSP